MIKKNRVIAVIPARAGSKTIIDKNVTLLAGKELIGWTIEAAKSSKYIDRVIVSTDGKKISEVANRFGAEVYVRPKHLSQDSSLVIDCLRNLISRLKREKETANYLILLEPTSPLRNTKDIDLSIEKLLDFDSVATFCNAELNPHRAWKIKGNTVEPFINGAIPWLPRQQLPEAFQLNGAVYGFRIDKLPIDGQSIIFGNIAAIKMPIERSIDIDSMIHLKMAEHIIRGKND